MSDVIMQFDHQGRVFARKSNDTLQLEVDDHGLKVTADLGGTEIGRQLYEEIKGGYVTKMSFGFTVAKDSMDPQTIRRFRRVAAGQRYDRNICQTVRRGSCRRGQGGDPEAG